ncbi:hypothetical protein J6590_014861 [Homalodisca vitripennis]|nr:hypothetical protein J6590_014861 [Homalodisca vitripennis]
MVVFTHQAGRLYHYCRVYTSDWAPLQITVVFTRQARHLQHYCRVYTSNWVPLPLLPCLHVEPGATTTTVVFIRRAGRHHHYCRVYTSSRAPPPLLSCLHVRPGASTITVVFTRRAGRTPPLLSCLHVCDTRLVATCARTAARSTPCGTTSCGISVSSAAKSLSFPADSVSIERSRRAN